jgi:hypothetical protein
MCLLLPATRRILYLSGLCLALVVCSCPAYSVASNDPKDSTAIDAAALVDDIRDFPELNQLLSQELLLDNQTSELTQEYLQYYVGQQAAAESLKQRAQDVIEKLIDINNFVGELRPDGLFQLPLGMKKELNGRSIIIAISQVKFQPTYAELTAFARIEIPQEPKELFFGLEGIKLSYDGGIVGDAKLVLLGDIPVRINGGSSALILKGENNLAWSASTGSRTYLTFDCNGFKELGIAADVEFPRSLLIPVNATGERIEDPNKRVKGSFATVVADWSDMLIELDLPDFQIPYLNDIVFQLRGAVLDLSDIRNSPNILYPRNYETNYMTPGSPELWRGVYAKNVGITLPKQFEDSGDPGKRISFTGMNMLIDNNGLSGYFAAKNVLPIESGSASGWKFSVDEIGIALEANNLTGASFKGLIGVPVAEDDLFAYTAVMMPDDYMLKVETRNKLNFSLWNAKVEIDPNSWVQLHLKDDHFRPEAMLHGRMSIGISSSDDGGSSLGKFDGLEFRSLHIMTEAPYLEVEYFGYAGEVKFANFPVSLENIAVTAQNGKAALGFTIKLNLMESQFGATTRLQVKSALRRDEHGNQSWKYDGIGISAISIHATISGCLKIDGSIVILEDDPVYGNGVAGQLQATFIPINVEVKARAMFGSKEFRYWFVDGSVSYGDGIPVFGPLRIHGFGGGASYHMKRSIAHNMSYVPDAKTYFGIKAAVLFNIATRSLIDGEASFEIGFNKNFGINYIGFFGDAKFMGKIPGTENIEEFVNEQKQTLAKYEDAYLKDNPLLAKELERMKIQEPSRAAEVLMGDLNKVGSSGMISAHVGILMDFTEKTFHSTFDVYVNVAGGLLRGVGANNRAGWSVMHIGPDGWYVYMGTPVDRLGIQFGLGSFSMKTGGYFMAGSKVLDAPPPPSMVADILGIELKKLDYMRDLNALADGRGFAFGTDFSVSTGDINFLILYAKFDAGAGFDIMLRDYGSAHCEGSTDPIGIDGWYANGQAYAYLQGEVGVSIRLFGIKKKFSVMSGGAAVLLQAKLPNPTAFKGYLAVHVDVLGGLVSGSFRLKISLGDDCHIVNDSGSPLVLNVISDLKPIDQSKEVDVFAAPQAAFNMRMEQPFYIDDDEGTKTYRIRLEEFTVTDNGQAVAGKIVWNSNQDIATFYSTEVLPPQKELKARVRVSFELQRGETWQQVMDQGQKATELKEVIFTTGTAPDNIPLTNVEYAYPVVDQRNYYRDESPAGYIQLKRGQSYLFPTDWNYEIRMGQTGKGNSKQTVVYNVAEKRIDFTIPTLELSNTYFMGLVAVPTDPRKGQQNAATPEQRIQTEDGDLTVKNNQAADVLQVGLGKSLIDYSFHTSKHTRFADKVKGLSIREPYVGKVSSDVINLQPLMASYEPFDIHEITGTSYTHDLPLVVVNALPEDEHYRQDIYPLLYKNYPVAQNIVLTNRDTTEFGLYPRRSLPVQQFYINALSDDASPHPGTRLPYTYDLTRIYQRDFIDLQAQIVNRFLGTSRQSEYAYIIMGTYPMMRYGPYKVHFQYMLPDGSKGSSGVFSYFNPIK